MNRKVLNKVNGFNTIDGDNVHLVRVLGRTTYKDFDPILMLDSFDSKNYEDYKNGFPFHPHRGMITITFLSKGKIQHRDSMRHQDTISDGEVQLMVAGSGVLHEERLPESQELLGTQLWLNLPKDKKMVPPEYHSIKNSEIKEFPIDGGKVRLLVGKYKEYQGFDNKYHPLDYYDVLLDKNKTFNLKTDEDKVIIIFSLKGNLKIEGEIIKEKTAVRLSQGDFVEIQALDEDTQFLFIQSERLDQEVAWGGPIVMNNDSELATAYRELESGTFLKDNVEY
eukprot:Anaeramoba_ignava/a348637_15.p1 GENE.a348637_15~~a348637_15.p1  ORF type:complete len:280 (+),score=21.29 a348637_15:426-1265(+)